MHHLQYMIACSFERTMREYKAKDKVIKSGRIVQADALSDR